MKNVYIIHGWDGNPKEPMLNWLKNQLKEKGYKVIAPEMPDPEVPIIEKWINKINEIVDVKEESIFVGHSIGCQAVLRYLEQAPENLKTSGILLLAPWMKLDEETIKEDVCSGCGKPKEECICEPND